MRDALLLTLLGALAAGCQSTADCAERGPSTGIAAQAALLRVEIYPPPARCLGAQVQPMGAAPLRVLSQAPSALQPLALAAGEVVVHVQAFGDAGGTSLVGEGCSSATISGGGGACLDLQVVRAGGGGDGGCQPVTHSNGVGQSYTDCAPTGAVDARLALLACVARTGDSAKCKTMKCSGGGSSNAVCATEGRCVCWAFDGAAAGTVHESSGGSCDCGVGGDPTWN